MRILDMKIFCEGKIVQYFSKIFISVDLSVYGKTGSKYVRKIKTKNRNRDIKKYTMIQSNFP